MTLVNWNRVYCLAPAELEEQVTRRLQIMASLSRILRRPMGRFHRMQLHRAVWGRGQHTAAGMMQNMEQLHEHDSHPE